MSQDNYYNSKSFKALLHDFEDTQKRGVPFLVSVDDYSDIAGYYADRGQYDKARHVIDITLKLYPDTPGPQILRARLALIEDSDTEEARRLLEKVADHSEPEYVYTMADIMLMEDNANGADKYLYSVFKGMDDEGERDDYVMDVVDTFLDYDMPKRAEKWLKRCRNKQSDDYKELKGRVLMGLGRYEECEDIMNGLIDRDPFSGDYWNTLASSQFLRGNIKESIESSEYSIAIDPNDPSALTNRANGLFMLGNYEEAMKCYENIIHARPEDASSYYMLALCQLYQNDVETARKTIATAEKKNEPNGTRLQSFLIEIGLAFGKIGHIDEAMTYIDDAATVCKPIPEEINMARGQVYLENDMENEARDCFIDAMAEAGRNPRIMMRITIAIYESGLVEMAYRIFKVLVEVDDENVRRLVYAYLAACCYELKKKREFTTNVRKAMLVDSQAAVLVLRDIFPDDAKPEEYIRIAKDLF